jgi:hypothetical protein
MSKTNGSTNGQAKGLNEAQRHKADEFLAALQGATVSDACAAAKVGRRTVYRWKSQDADFSASWDALTEETTDRIEKKTIELALNEKGDGQEYPQLLMFLLERRRKATYQKGLDVNHSGGIESKGPNIPTGAEFESWFDRLAEIRNGGRGN